MIRDCPGCLGAHGKLSFSVPLMIIRQENIEVIKKDASLVLLNRFMDIYLQWTLEICYPCEV